MTKPLPDVRALAQTHAQALRANPTSLDSHLDRALADSPQVTRQQLLSGVLQFHRDRMAAVPPKDKYPEAGKWVDNIVTYQKELQAAAGLSEAQLAQYLSLAEYIRFRAFREGARPQGNSDEKCRVAYLPDSDRGQFHIKNVDDPPVSWRKLPPITQLPMDHSQLVWDGTGSGLHIDDEPAEIFPLDVRAMLAVEGINDVPAAVEFLTRYSRFWSSANCVLHDAQKRSVAIEKCTRNHMAVHYPGSDGRSWCSGMVCRDKNSDIAKYQTARRQEYLDLFGLPCDGPDGRFWAMADDLEVRLANLITGLGTPASTHAVEQMFLKPVGEGGLNKNGTRAHPAQQLLPYTLITHIYYLDQKAYARWVRDEQMNPAPQPESFQA